MLGRRDVTNQLIYGGGWQVGRSPGWASALIGWRHNKERAKPLMTLPTKVPSDNLGRIGSLKRTSDKSLFPMALGSCGYRITHQLYPINMNGRSILAVTSLIVFGFVIGLEDPFCLASLEISGRRFIMRD